MKENDLKEVKKQMKTFYFYTYEGVGKLGIGVESDSITDIDFERSSISRSDTKIEETELHRDVFRQLQEYFSGSRKVFDLPLAPVGTDFQMRCWEALLKIPYGETRSYGDIARSVQSPKGFRAVGMANNRNPIAIVIPCHRVIGSDGKLVGFGGGLDIKKFLLDIENRYANS